MNPFPRPHFGVPDLGDFHGDTTKNCCIIPHNTIFYTYMNIYEHILISSYNPKYPKMQSHVKVTQKTTATPQKIEPCFHLLVMKLFPDIFQVSIFSLCRHRFSTTAPCNCSHPHRWRPPARPGPERRSNGIRWISWMMFIYRWCFIDEL